MGGRGRGGGRRWVEREEERGGRLSCEHLLGREQEGVGSTSRVSNGGAAVDHTFRRTKFANKKTLIGRGEEHSSKIPTLRFYSHLEWGRSASSGWVTLEAPWGLGHTIYGHISSAVGGPQGLRTKLPGAEEETPYLLPPHYGHISSAVGGPQGLRTKLPGAEGFRPTIHDLTGSSAT